MLYEHGRLSLGYVLCAFPIFALVGGHVEVALCYVMVRNVLGGETTSTDASVVEYMATYGSIIEEI